MLGTLTEKFRGILAKMSGQRKLTEENIGEAMGQVRLALLEADVNYAVAKTLVTRVREKALGEAVMKSVTPGQLFIKIVHDELKALMGGEESALDFASQKPAVIMMCGLQGSGKTTQCAKLAHFLKKQKLAKLPLLVACDLQRPAAVDQLKVLGEQAHVAVFAAKTQDPLEVAKQALRYAQEHSHDVIIFDTAGRLHIDEEMMTQLQRLKQLIKPSEVLFVANAATGQDAVNVAAEFHKRVEITGTILTMLDGNTRGGAAISIREVTGKPLKFEGIGERLDDIQVFHPGSMADRILGMGDTINLVKKAQEHIDEEEAKKLEEKLRKASFTYNDYLSQIQAIKKMGSLKSLLGMLPGVGNLTAGLDFNEKEFFKIEAIIQSMTPDERAEVKELIPGRRKRIAAGSGTKIEDVNKLVKSFKQMKQLFKNMPAKKNLQKMLGGALWH